jgi:hypothetical protein
MRGFVDSPTFYSDVELSATDLNDLSNNLVLADAASRRKYPVHYINRMTGKQAIDGSFGELVEGNWIWRGGFQYRVGLTTARFVVFIDPHVGNMVAANKFQILFNDVVVHEQAVLTGGWFTIDIALGSLGYTDYQIITTICRVNVVNPYPNERIIGEIYVFDAYVFPISGISITSNPTLTNFGDLTATRLNDLSNKIDYLIQRMALVPIMPTHAFIMFQLIGWGIWNQHWLSTRVNFGADATHLKLHCYWLVFSPGTKIRIRLNGITNEYGPFTAGQHWPSGGTIEIPMTDFSAVANTDYLMSIFQAVDVDARCLRGDRLVLTAIEVVNPSETAIVSPAVNEMLESLQFDALQTRLNSYITAANTIDTRITDRAAIWDRAQMFRARMSLDEGQDEYWKTEMVHRMIRTGDILWVKGRNVRIGWGPSSSEPVKGDEEDIEIKWEYEETLTSANVESKIFYLDQFESLTPGTEYFITGDVHYAAEHLR